jgi:hypothetical protein
MRVILQQDAGTQAICAFQSVDDAPATDTGPRITMPARQPKQPKAQVKTGI